MESITKNFEGNIKNLFNQDSLIEFGVNAGVSYGVSKYILKKDADILPILAISGCVVAFDKLLYEPYMLKQPAGKDTVAPV